MLVGTIIQITTLVTDKLRCAGETTIHMFFLNFNHFPRKLVGNISTASFKLCALPVVTCGIVDDLGSLRRSAQLTLVKLVRSQPTLSFSSTMSKSPSASFPSLFNLPVRQADEFGGGMHRKGVLSGSRSGVRVAGLLTISPVLYS